MAKRATRLDGSGVHFPKKARWAKEPAGHWWTNKVKRRHSAKPKGLGR